MTLNNNQWALIIGAFVLFGVLYFGCDTTPPEIKDSEKSRSMNIEATSVQNIMRDAAASMTREQRAVIDLINKEMEESTDSTKTEYFIQLSSKWYEYGYPAIAGHYAQLVAEDVNDENSWSIAGTTYTLCIKASQDQIIKDFCSGRARKAFESALSLNPDNINHRINMALVNVENPPNGMPMTGILQLRELNEQYPESTAVINQLARLAIRTGQYDRAIERLTQALSLDPENQTSICLIAEAYELSGKASEGTIYREKCLNSTSSIN